jgi:hypothetical protein
MGERIELIMKTLVVLITMIVMLGAAPAIAQNIPPPTTTSDQTAATTLQASETPVEGARVRGTGENGKPQAYWTFKTPYEFWLTGLTIALLGVTLAALTIVAWRTGFTTDFTRTFVIIVIIFAAIFMIAAGYSDIQAAPVYGLLGTMTGYIFGRSTAPPNGTPGGAQPQPEPNPAPGQGPAGTQGGSQSRGSGFPQ